MKKNFALLLLAILISPSVAFASWWNPFSWNIFHFFQKSDDKTQILENRISELEQKLASTTSSTNLSKNIEKDSMPIVTPKSATSESINITKTVPQENVSSGDIAQLTTDLVIKFKTLNEQVKGVISKYGYSSLNGLSGTDYVQADTLNSITKKISSSVYDLESTSPSQENINLYTTQYNNLFSSFKDLRISNISQTQNYTSSQSSSQNQENSASCIKAKNDATDAYNIYIQAQNNLQQQISNIYSRSGTTREQANQEVEEISRVGNANLAVLAVKANSAQTLMSSVCYNIVPTFVPPTQTNCQIYGNSASCTTY